MKKLFIFSIMCLMALSMQAQRCAVLEFKAGVGIKQSDVDGISAIFITYFRPAGYMMVERTQINKAIEEGKFQRSNITEKSQMVRLGEILNVSRIVIGDINVVMKQYNVDVRVIDAKTGTVVATEGATFAPGSSYRATMQSLAQRLANKIATKSGSTIKPTTPKPATQTSTAPKQTKEPQVIYGYLKVFPDDLGTFDAEPTTVIARLNQAKQYGYGTWRLPTKEELDLMRANNVVGSGTYMTSETKNTRGTVRLVTDKEKGDTNPLRPVVPAGYVDLGLPSGTLWKDRNEAGGYYNSSEATDRFRDRLPTREQIQELIDNCEWEWKEYGYLVTGPNHNSIFLPANGHTDCVDNQYSVGIEGKYWSSEPNGSARQWDLDFRSKRIEVSYSSWCVGHSVRLVFKP